MIRRRELSDAEWELAQPLLPRPALGRPRLDDRTILNGIGWEFRTGVVAWRDVPDRYGSWATLHTRFRRWAADGAFERTTGPGEAATAADRRPSTGKQVYKHRNVVERCFNLPKQWHGIATRYDKTAQSYQAAVTLASLPMWACQLDDNS